MAFNWNRFAYTNFHELNLDWFNEHFKEIFEEWEELYNTLTQWKEDTDTDLAEWKRDTLADMNQWENDLLDTLDTWKRETGQEFNDDITTWEAGVISDLNDWKQDFNDAFNTMYNRVDAIVSDTEDMIDNLAEPFDNTKNYFVDDFVIYNGLLYRFTSDHAAGAWNASHAQQSTAMNDYGNVVKAIHDFNSYDIFENVSWVNQNYNGVQFTWDDRGICTASGTSTGSGNYNVFVSTSFPEITDGDILTFIIDNTITNINMQLFIYRNGGWSAARILHNGYQTMMPENTTGLMIRFVVPDSGLSVSGTCKIKCLIAPSNELLERVSPIVLPSETIERDGIISNYLTKYGIVQLSEGTFLIHDLVMPDNTIIKGCGDRTVLKVDNDAHSGSSGLKPGANCIIENLKIISTAGHTNARGNGSGIDIVGNYDSAPYKYNIKIDNVTIEGFALSGIHIAQTGYWYANSVSATNCRVYNCYSGIQLEDFAEYNRFTNCLFYNNYAGAFILSGNNNLVNCTLSGNTLAVYLEGTHATMSGNNGHGALIGCTLNHNNSDTGFAAIIKGITNGFIFSGCNIWYGKIICDTGGNGNKGITFANCIFGGGTPSIANWSGTLLLNGCEFQTAPTLTGNQPIVKANCYLFDGTQLT